MEWIPPMNDKNWAKVKNNPYYEYKTSPIIIYNINKKFLLKIPYIHNIGDNIGIVKIYHIYNYYSSIVTYTYTNILNDIYDNIQKYNNNLSSVFDNFISLNNTTVKMIKCIKIMSNANIKDIVDTLNTSYTCTYQFILNHYNTYKRYYNINIKDYINFKLKIGYIYKIYNKSNNKTYYGVTTTNITDKNISHILSLIASKNILMTNDIDQLKLNVIEQYKYKTLTGLSIYLDHYIIKNNSINTGYNTIYKYIKPKETINNIKKRIFLNIQQEYIKEHFKENNKKRFVCQILNKVTNDHYIETSTNKTIKNLLLQLYDEAHTNTSKNIYNALIKYKFTDFDIIYLE